MASNDLPTCDWNESKDELFCFIDALYENSNKFKDFFQRPCHVLEYVGSKTLDSETNLADEIWFEYGFAQPEMTIEYKERLVFDGLGLVVYVGGILGMCVGFSFIGFTATVLGFIKSIIINPRFD